MPNHCWQTLSVVGPMSDVEDFVARVTAASGDDAGIIRAYLPFPAELEGDPITGSDGTVLGRAFTTEGYDWCLTNWGTKWGDYDTELVAAAELVNGMGHTYLTFTSAWSPMVEGLRRLSALTPTLKFFLTYREEANEYLGAAVLANGAVVAQHDVEPERIPAYPEDTDDETEWLDAIDELVMEAEQVVGNAA